MGTENEYNKKREEEREAISNDYYAYLEDYKNKGKERGYKLTKRLISEGEELGSKLGKTIAVEKEPKEEGKRYYRIKSKEAIKGDKLLADVLYGVYILMVLLTILNILEGVISSLDVIVVIGLITVGGAVYKVYKHRVLYNKGQSLYEEGVGGIEIISEDTIKDLELKKKRVDTITKQLKELLAKEKIKLENNVDNQGIREKTR